MMFFGRGWGLGLGLVGFCLVALLTRVITINGAHCNICSIFVFVLVALAAAAHETLHLKTFPLFGEP
jgi:hypothetical protein